MSNVPQRIPCLVSIVICTRGRCAQLEATLESLSKLDVPSDIRAELLLIENGLKGNAETLSGAFRNDRISMRYLFEAQSGKSRALNRAIAESQSDILLFTDDDIRFPSGWIEKMCAPIIDGKADAVAGGVKLADDLLRPWMTRLHRAWLASTADYLSANNPSEMCGANMAISRRSIDYIGGFDTALGPGVTNGGEESLMSWQLKEGGFSLVGALDVYVEHHLDPKRLYYRHWIEAALLRGKTDAYLGHHWFRYNYGTPFASKLYFSVKLFLRRLFSRRRRLDDEGIPLWELSYIQELSKFDYYLKLRHRPRKYPFNAVRKGNLKERI